MPTTASQSPSIRTLVERFILLGFVMAVLHLGKPVLLPIVTAAMVTLLLIPVVRPLEAIGLPRGLAAGVVVVGFVGACALAGAQLRGPAEKWIERAPRDLAELRQEVQELRAPVDSMVAAADDVAQGGEESGGDRVEVDANPDRSFSDQIARVTWQSLTFFVLVTALVFFMLMRREGLLAKTVMLAPDQNAWERVEQTATDIRRRLSMFIATMTVINVGLGTAVGAVLWVLEYENPILWGVMVAVLNFVPYLGSATGMLIVGVIGLLTFDGYATALIAVSGYLALTTLEGTVISPGLLSSRLRLDPVATLVGLVVFGFVWGLPGVILTVPLLVCVKVISQNYGRAATLAALVGRDHPSVPSRSGAGPAAETSPASEDSPAGRSSAGSTR